MATERKIIRTVGGIRYVQITFTRDGVSSGYIDREKKCRVCVRWVSEKASEHGLGPHGEFFCPGKPWGGVAR